MQYHVSKSGSDLNPGTKEQPFLSISMAAIAAKPGDVVTVHEGIYREWVSPQYGGTAAQRIVYQAAEGEKVVITGAEVITDWVQDGDIWKTEIDNGFFGSFNPYAEPLCGDWLFEKDYTFHLGQVYLDGRGMYEAKDVEAVRNPATLEESTEAAFSTHVYYAEVDEKRTVIYANFQGADPTKGTVEINVRRYCFFPAKTGVGYITVRGFTMNKAATQWAPPTAMQDGLIGPHWSKGWIIENNIISDSRCSGVSLGKDESTGQNEWMNLKCKGGTQREREVIFRAVNNNWSKDNIGSHIVRGNTIFNCGQTGVVGHLGGVFSTIENNHIYNITYMKQFHGAEVGGIKMHAAIDTVIRGNIIHNAYRGVWLDWQGQGTRITRNVFFDNSSEDVFVEVSHGPTTIDHNLMLSAASFKTMAQGCALVHNLITGQFAVKPDQHRYTPYHVPHSTAVAGVMLFMGGDDRYYNNLFVRDKNDTNDEPVLASFWSNAPQLDGLPGAATHMLQPVGTAAYDDYPGADDPKPWELPFEPGRREEPNLPVYIGQNLYFNNAKPCKKEKGAMVEQDSGVEVTIDRENKKVIVRITNPALFTKNRADTVTTEVLGYGFQAEMPFENADGTPYCFDIDFFDKARQAKVVPGPFEVEKAEAIEISFA